MREIKFRGWDADGKIFYYSGDLYNWKAFAEFMEIDFCSKPIFMQYTGLKDKNGKEIYEDDIVIDDWYPTEAHPIELPIEGKYKIVYLAPEWCCEKINDTEFSGILGMNDFSDMKVIGNIHENPELLKE